jgi:hypothetical protein
MTKLEQTNDAARPRENDGLNFQRAISKDDWEQHSSNRTKQPGSDLPSTLTFDDTIYGVHANPALNKTAADLRHDVSILEHSRKGGEQYNEALTELHADEAQLKKDVFSLKDKSSDFQSFSGVMNQYHDELKSVATELWHMGLKSEASQTTAYYPLSHYEHEFKERAKHGDGGSSGGSGGDNPTPKPPTVPPGGDTGGTKPPTGATAFTGLDNANNEKPNIKPGEIGGSGGITSISADQNGNDSLNFSMSGAAWGDGLWLTSVKNPVTAQNKDFKVQLDTTFSMTASQLANNHEIEKDIAGPWGIAGTEINTKTGQVDFWNAAGSKWVNVGSLGPLEANKKYDLQLNVTSMGNPDSGTFSYDNYSLNGQKLNASQNTFHDKNLGWAPGLYIQTQLDLPGKPTGAAGMTESNQTFYVS